MSHRYKIFPFILFLFYSACILCPGRFVFVSPSTQEQFAPGDDASQPCNHRHQKADHQRCQSTNEYLPSQKTSISAEMAVQSGVPQSLQPVAAVLPPDTLLPQQHPPNLIPQPVSLFIKLRI